MEEKYFINEFAVRNENKERTFADLLNEDCKFVSEEMYDRGHRKLSDGAVVLLIGENNQALDGKTIEYFVKHNEQIRKETAKEILKKVFKKDNLVSDESGSCITMTYEIDVEEAREIAREYDVKIEEL